MLTNIEQKNEYQAELFKNRLIKRYKHLKKWAKRTDVNSFRIYDKDIPEIPLAVDLYENENAIDKYLQIALYERPYEKDEQEETDWLDKMCCTASNVLSIPIENITVKIRKHQKENSQYGKNNTANDLSLITLEQNARFLIKLSAYLDTGLFFDHRPLRRTVRETCKNKSVLNLFCYTGSFSVYAAQGQASFIDSVDLSKTYIQWAEENLKLNGFNLPDKRYQFHQVDSIAFLNKALSEKKHWDIIILDPPTFSNSKKTETTLDINKDWIDLVNICLKLLSPKGTLYFSTNSRKISFNDSLILQKTENGEVFITDITTQTIPEDYRNSKIHRCWQFTLK